MASARGSADAAAKLTVADDNGRTPGPRGDGVDEVHALDGARRALRQVRDATTRVPVWSARLVFLLGLINVAAAVLPRHRAVFDWSIDFLPPLGRASASAVSIGVGFGLLSMARGLRQRKRRAWVIVLGLLLLAVVAHVLRGTDHVQTVISAVLIAVLLAGRHHFIGRADPRSRRWVPLVFVVMLACTWLVGCAVTLGERRDLLGGWSAKHVAEHSFLGLLGISGPLRFVDSASADENSILLLGLGITTAVITIAAWLGSTRSVPAGSVQDRLRIRELLIRHGRLDSLGYFATREDKSYTFSTSGKAAVAYKVVSGVCLASGDPIGDVEAWAGAIGCWLEQTLQQAWIPAVLGASETGAEVYRRVGLDALEIGDEAVVEVADFTLEGRSMRTVRQAVNRARRAGYTVTIERLGDMVDDDVREVEQTSGSWQTSRTPERGFSMALSRFGAAADRDCVLACARSSTGEVMAVLQLVPWGPDGLSLDAMRRHPELDNGVMELLIADLLGAAPRIGIIRVSLNFAVFRSSLARGERIGAGPFTRAWFRVLLFLSRWWQIASLYRANAKFRPSWQPRFLCFALTRDLVPIAYAALQAEGFLTVPRPFRRHGHHVRNALTQGTVEPIHAEV